MKLLDVVAGWTGVLGPFTLKADGVALDLSGLTVTMVASLPDGEELSLSGALTVNADQTGHRGEVTYAPASTDFAVTADANDFEYQVVRVRFRATDGSTVVFFPNAGADEIYVYPQ